MNWPPISRLGHPAGDDRFCFEALGPQHNERDHEAWMTSLDHIRATPGFSPDGSWPSAMTLDDNLADLQMHATEFAAGEAYAYSVLDPSTDEVIGCVYVDPDASTDRPPDDEARASVRSWVRADRSALDLDVATAVAAWLVGTGAFASVRWPGRPELGN